MRIKANPTKTKDKWRTVGDESEDKNSNSCDVRRSALGFPRFFIGNGLFRLAENPYDFPLIK